VRRLRACILLPSIHYHLFCLPSLPGGTAKALSVFSLRYCLFVCLLHSQNGCTLLPLSPSLHGVLHSHLCFCYNWDCGHFALLIYKTACFITTSTRDVDYIQHVPAGFHLNSHSTIFRRCVWVSGAAESHISVRFFIFCRLWLYPRASLFALALLASCTAPGHSMVAWCWRGDIA